MGKVGNSVKVEKATASGGPFSGGAKPSRKSTGNDAWQYVAIPLKVEGKVKGNEEPDYVPALTVTIYLVFGQGRGETPLLMQKTMTYVEVPVGDIEVAAFISPADARKIAEKEKGDLSGKLQAIALEVEFNGDNCVKAGTNPSHIFEAQLKQKLSGRWWKKRGETKGAELRCISETPLAPFYAGRFPATKPIYGAPTGSSAGGGASVEPDAGSDDE